MDYFYCDAATGDIVESETIEFEDPYPASDYVNLQCYCDLGRIPSTFGTADISFSLTEKAITCYSGWNLTYQWMSADFDGSNENIISG